MTTVDRITSRIKEILSNTLELGDRVQTIESNTPFLGNIPELDSVAVVTIILTLEKEFSISINDDEISAKTFATLDTLVHFVASKLTEKTQKTD